MASIKPVEEASQDFAADLASLRDDVAKLSSSLLRESRIWIRKARGQRGRERRTARSASLGGTFAPAAVAFASVSERLATSYPVTSRPYGRGRWPSETSTTILPNGDSIRTQRQVSFGRPISAPVALASSAMTFQLAAEFGAVVCQ
jgi:hypothetical protein